MTTRFLTAASVFALLSACSGQPGPSSTSLVDQGYAAYRAGDFAGAEAAYRGALADLPTDEAAMLGLAEVMEATDRAGEAATLYRRVQAARSGTIRVWDDGRAMQDGVTEVASRRLGALGHDTGFQAPPVHHPVVSHSAPVSVWPEDPVYALDEDGIVYYADPEATQPITEPVFESPDAAMTTYPTFEQAGPAVVAPPSSVYESAPMTYAPEPMSYESAPMTYETAPMVEPMTPMSYEAAPMTYEALPAETMSAPIPVAAPARIEPVAPVAPVYSPAPVSARVPSTPAPSAPLGQPGYAVVDGNFVYISAEDIAAGATPPSPVAGVETFESYGTPTPIAGSAIPLDTPSTYSAPRGVDVQNGIAIPNLN